MRVDTIPPRPAPDSISARGLTVADVAARYRVGEDKVRLWIRRGELAAINTAATLCGKPR
jgi:transposase